VSIHAKHESLTPESIKSSHQGKTVYGIKVCKNNFSRSFAKVCLIGESGAWNRIYAADQPHFTIVPRRLLNALCT
jgi:hypothetical protein